MIEDFSRFEGIVPAWLIVHPSGSLEIFAGPLPGITPPLRRMREVTTVQTSVHDGLLCIAAHIPLVGAGAGGFVVGGELTECSREDMHRIEQIKHGRKRSGHE